MSSLSHHASRTIAVAVAAIPNARAVYQIHRHRDCAIADARKNAYGMPSGTSHRHGNCRNCNFGKCRQSQRLAGNIIRADATASVTIIHQSVEYSRRRRALKTAVMPVSNIVPRAMLETFQLNSANSGSNERVYRKFWARCRLPTVAFEICTHRCSYAAGKMENPASPNPTTIAAGPGNSGRRYRRSRQTAISSKTTEYVAITAAGAFESQIAVNTRLSSGAIAQFCLESPRTTLRTPRTSKGKSELARSSAKSLR